MLKLIRYKYKGVLEQSFGKFTSKTIGDKNIFDLTNMQISQLLQDLIRNDAKVKGSRAQARQSKYDDPLETYKRLGLLEEEMDEEEIQRPKTKNQKNQRKNMLTCLMQERMKFF